MLWDFLNPNVVLVLAVIRFELMQGATANRGIIGCSHKGYAYRNVSVYTSCQHLHGPNGYLEKSK